MGGQPSLVIQGVEGERRRLVEIDIVLGMGVVFPGEPDCGDHSRCHQQRASREGGRRRRVRVAAQEGREVTAASRSAPDWRIPSTNGMCSGAGGWGEPTEKGVL